VEDLAGNFLAAEEEWEFATGEACQDALVLEDTATFGVLSNTGVTLGGGPTSVTGFRVIGDVGIFPGALTDCVGCDTTTVDGEIVVGTADASDAMDEVTALYNDAAARSDNLCTLIDSGSLATNPALSCGGTANGTFYPGLYWSATSISIPAGATITLDAQNDPDAVFIFQSESTIGSLGGDTHIVLANQAQAKNVFWLAKSSATIGGTDSDFVGTIIAQTAITVNTGTEVIGRAFARTASVTIQDGASITVPAM
jgi:Ice-binding-like